MLPCTLAQAGLDQAGPWDGLSQCWSSSQPSLLLPGETGAP